jgi:TolB-like protein
MICSTSSSSKAVVVCEFLALLFLSNCALPSRRAGAPLEFKSLTSNKDGPAVASVTSIRWTADFTGGTGELTYEFRSRRNSVEIAEQEGRSPTWDWNPRKAGTYRVKVTAVDGASARADSGWSPAIVVLPPVSVSDLIAVLPVDNLTGGRAPLETVGRLLRTKLNEKGFRLLDDDVLEEFMKRYRIRYTGSVISQVSRAVREETGAAALLITSLEVFQETDPPRVALFSRLVSSGERPEIEWIDGVALSGSGSPGLLGLGLIEEPDILLEMAIQCLAESLARSLSETATDTAAPALSQNDFSECDPRGNIVTSSAEGGGSRKHRPHEYFRSPIIDANKRYSVAVIPFLNLSERRNAGNILALHFVDWMFRNESLTVIEPGLVREQLLKYRIIMEAGPSFANAELLSSNDSLGADLVLSGVVFDYQDAVGVPTVDFSVKVIEKTSRSVVWSSRSHNTGDDGVFFFDLGRVHTAHRLASEMARATFEALRH